MTQTHPKSLSHFERDLSRSLARRGKALLEADDLTRQVSRMEPLEVYFMVKELGLESAGPILMCASADQLQAFVDLDCWQGEHINFDDIDVWLAPFASLSSQALVAAFLSLEDQLQALYLRDALVIFQKVDEEIPTTGRKDVRNRVTSDGRFVIEPKEIDSEKEIDPLDLVAAIYKFAGPDQGYNLILYTLSEMQSPLYEDAWRFRSNRLMEMGFPEFTDSLQLFSKPGKKAPGVYIPKGPSLTKSMPAIYASPLNTGGLLSLGLLGIEDKNVLSHLESNLIYLVNASVVAFEESPSNLDYTQAIAKRTIGLLNLGLEVLVGKGEPIVPERHHLFMDEVKELLQKWPLRDIFKYGYQETLRLHLAAKQLLEDPVMKIWAEKHQTELDEYSEEMCDREFVKALAKPRPLWAGWDRIHPTKTKGFGSLHDIEAALERLDKLAEQHG